MNFTGKWRLRNGWEADVEKVVNGVWQGEVRIGASTVHAEWDKNGDATPPNKDLDLMERLGWRARV